MKIAEPSTNNTSPENVSYWQYHTQQWAQSSLLKSTYCKQHDVNYPRFIYWSKKFTEQALPDLVEVKIKPDMKTEKTANEIRCTLQLKNNIYLHIESRQALLTILAHLS
jgi:hypothetical protein